MVESIIIYEMHQICKEFLGMMKNQSSLDLFLFMLEYVLDYEKIEYEIIEDRSFICIIKGVFAIKMMAGDIIDIEDIEFFKLFCKDKAVDLGSIYMFPVDVEYNSCVAHINIYKKIIDIK